MIETQGLVIIVVAAVVFIISAIYAIWADIDKIESTFLRVIVILLPAVSLAVMSFFYAKHGVETVKAPIILFERVRGRRKVKGMTPAQFDSVVGTDILTSSIP